MMFHAILRLAAAAIICLAADAPARADGRRVALVIGNAHYQSLPALENPSNDVANVSSVLRASGFDVVVGVDLERVALEKTIERFFRSLGNSDVSLFYYSGHGVQVAGRNYIIPVDASLKSAYDIETQTMNLDTILDFMRANTKTQLVFLDACRNNPFGTKAYWVADKLEPVVASAGLAGVKPSVGTLISFATEPGSVSYDGGDNKMSPFSSAFVKRALTPNDEIRAMLSRVRRDVVDATGGRQVPWENSSLVDDFFLMPRRPPPSIAAMTKRDVAPGRTVALRLPQPQVDGTGQLSVTFDLLPEGGKLALGDAAIVSGKAYPVSVLRDAVYQANGASPGSTNVASFTISDDIGQSTRGLVAIAVAKEAPAAVASNDAAKGQEVAKAEIALDKSLDETSTALSKIEISAPIGVGPVALADEPLVQLASLDAPVGSTQQIKLTDTPTTGVLRLGDRKVVSGAVIDSDNLGKLSYEPQIGEEGQPQTLKVEVMAAATATAKPAQLTLKPVVDACDTLAGEPLDLQGVAKGVLPNEIKLPDALDACRKAAATHPDVARFLFQLGRAQLADRDVAAATKSFTAAAKRGYSRADYQLGNLAWLGTGRPADIKAANLLYKKNSDFGDGYGMLSYGRNLFYGRGIKADQVAGLKLMIRAAELGHTYAMNELGAIFVEGRQVPADPARGIAYYKQGAARDDIYSFNNLGLAFMRGQGVATDDKAALTMFTKASDGGHPGAPANLGFLYLEGRAVDKNPAMARQFFQESADRGDWYGAMMRGQVALTDNADTEAQAEAARYYALAVAFDRSHGLDEPKQRLAAMPAAAKAKALEDISGKPAGKIKAGALDARLVEATLKDWKQKNPRMDLF